MISEDYPWFNREFDLFDGLTIPSYSPSGGSANFVGFIHEYVLKRALTLNFMNRYAYFKYDEIEVRITFYAPKNMTGAFVVALLPYQNRYLAGAISDQQYTNSELMLRQDSHFVDIGESYDVVMRIPWSYRFPVFSIQWLNASFPSATPRMPGDPIIAINKIMLNYVSSLTNYGVSVRAYVRYKGMQFFGPGSYSVPTDNPERQPAQSGWEKVASDFAYGTAKKVGEAAFDAGADAFKKQATDFACDNFGLFCKAEDEDPTSSFQEEPEAGNGFGGETISMLPSVVGDVTSVARSRLRTIFGSKPGPAVGAPVRTKGTHKFSHFLSRPQPVGYFSATGLTASSVVLSNNWWSSHNVPGMTNMDGGNIPVHTWLRYFKPLARYWRGITYAHFVICGHPMVEVEFQSRLSYCGAIGNVGNEGFSQYDTHRVVFSGSKTITVPMPFLTYLDYCVYGADDEITQPPTLASMSQVPNNNFTTLVSAYLTVRATMLDATPIIPCFVFFSCGPDFKLFQPLPPGVSYSSSALTQRTKKGSSVAVKEPPLATTKMDPNRQTAQVHIPSIQGGDIHMVSCNSTPDPGTMKPLFTFEELMSIWSRPDLGTDEDNPDPMIGLAFPNPAFAGATRTDWADKNPSTWFTSVDYIGYLSSMFLYWKGDISYKIFMPVDHQDPTALISEYVTFFKGPTLDQDLETCYTSTVSWLVDPAVNPGVGAMVAAPNTNPVVEFSLPYKGILGLGDVSIQVETQMSNISSPFKNYPLSCSFLSNLPLNGSDVPQEYCAAMRKIGPNFSLYVEGLPPPLQLYMYRGHAFMD